MRYLVPLGRLLFSLIFIGALFSNFSGASIDAAAAHGVPLATVVVPLAGIIAALGGLSVLLGFHARFGAFLILIFLVPVTLVMHKFWGLTDPQLAMMQKVNFLKNVSLMGAALMILSMGSGPLSADS